MPANLKSLVLRVSQGDPVAFKELFETFSPRVYAFALRVTHSQSTAEELVQDVFMKIWVNRESLQRVDHFQSWIYTVSRNLAFNVLKRLAVEERAKTQLLKDLKHEVSEPDSPAVYHNYEHMLQNAVDRLSPQQKLVYALCHQEGLKYEEAAEKLHISRLTVKTHMQQALRNIRSHVKSLVASTAMLLLFI